MKKLSGINEAVWAALSEDKRFKWKSFSRVVAIIGSFFVNKTGNAYIDWTITALTALFLLLVIETQRSYSRLSPLLRKNCLRVAIALGSWGLALVGISFFANIAVILSVAVLSSDVIPPMLIQPTHPLVVFITFVIFLIIMLKQIISSFRRLQLEELIYHRPREGLKNLFVHKRIRATSFPMFVYLELSALFVCLVYASLVAQIVKDILSLTRLNWMPGMGTL